MVDAPLKLSIFGATGGTGAALLRLALERGHQVTALARDPAAIATRHERLRVIEGDVLDRAAAGAAVAGADAVLSALGAHTGKAPTAVYSNGTGNIVDGMTATGVRRLVAVSSVVLAPRDAIPFFARAVVHPILRRVYGGLYADMERMEALLAGTDVDWTVVRPPRLTDRPATGRYRLDLPHPARSASAVSRGDLAQAMLALATSRTDVRGTVGIAPA